MGGLLAADTLREFANSCQDKDPLWPKVIACIGYDTPVRCGYLSSFGVTHSTSLGSTLAFTHLLSNIV